MRRALVVVVAALLWALAGTTVSAEPPYIATCGAVRAFTEPTPTAPGSVTIGTSTFALHSGDQLPSTTPLGAAMCINQTVTTAGPVLALMAMPSPICGEVVGILPAIPGQRAALIDIVTTTPGLRVALAASASLGFVFPGRSTVACFQVNVDAIGNAVAVRVIGGTVTAPTAPTPASTSGLPSTATGGTPDELAAFVVAASAIAGVLWRRRRGFRAR